MEQADLIWHNGEMVAWEDAKVHVLTHGLHYGTGVFEGERAYDTARGPAIFRHRDHLDRLFKSAELYYMPIPYTLEELRTATHELIAANELRECYIRPVVVRTGESMGVHSGNTPVEVFIICWVWETYLGEKGRTNGVDVCVSSWRRAAPDTFPMMAKAGGNYINSQLSKMEAKLDGYSEGIMLDANGHVAEGSGENLFAVRDNVLYTAPIGAGILNGITRDSIIRLAADMGLEVRQEFMPREFLYVVDELFFCGTAAEITPIKSVDRIPVGAGRPGEVTMAMQREYMGIVHGTIPDRHGWLTMVPEPAAALR